MKKPSLENRGWWPVLVGVGLFLAFQYIIALTRLTETTGGMENKFRALAKTEHLGFIIRENVMMLMGYAILLLLGAWLIQPFAWLWTKRSRSRNFWSMALRSGVLAFFAHGFCVLRLIEKRPYFLSDAEFGHWYFKIIETVPNLARPWLFPLLFTVFPVGLIIWVCWWHGRGRLHQLFGLASLLLVSGVIVIAVWGAGGRFRQQQRVQAPQPNVIIIGSDSLRGDRLGCSGYLPERMVGEGRGGVSPTIDTLAEHSAWFPNCRTAIGSTLESGTGLMASQYPHSHGIRHMYPDRETVRAAQNSTIPLAGVLENHGYDTAAIGDWCAGYYEIMPLEFDDISVSSFDNFEIYMSQAVVMAHFVIPLYFDNPLGYRLFPRLQSFAQFVTPDLVTERVERRLDKAARVGKPFFWHVFYSCNHLPYRSREPYVSMFADPAYRGKNRMGVDFDIDEFIGSTSLEEKWQALGPEEIRQIRALYDGCTRQFDDCVKRILASLERNGLRDDTIVVITSDHGDDLYETGLTLGHGLTFNGSARSFHVPLIIHVPGSKGRTIDKPVRLLDVAPTLVGLLGIEPPSQWEGQDLTQWVRGEAAPEALPFYGETSFPFVQFKVEGVERPPLPAMDEMTFIDSDYNYQFVLRPEYQQPVLAAKQRCLMTERWKLVCTPAANGTRHFALFRLVDDPDSLNDLADKRPEILEPMRTALELWIDRKIETPVSGIFPGGEP